ncbi:hypothetical protein [Sphingomonas baiyangensis]|uniref:Uncharacterized protein n=1 Tax=Sphingomonas baiyangensis TaxID=2572576 RepID=A0A4V5PTJ7_9SPHN|nr:hypothetical protein [Sphingomonas baiyangensis]TKD50348.1 hypothetical protein FBR43_05920 [Sphingomonas baiyangensis]
MSENELRIDDAATDGLSVAPPKPGSESDAGRGDAGTDRAITDDLADAADDEDAKLDRGLDESMDASDTPSSVQPRGSSDPAPSSGYHEESERQRDA